MSDEKVDLTPFESYTQNRLDSMWEKISELEKKLEVKYKNETGHALYHKDKLEPMIAELRVGLEAIEDHKPLIYGQLNELKEEDEHIKHIINVNRDGVSNLFTNYGEMKEVLRELFQRIGDNEDLSKIGYDLLAKLEVGSARQTGKTDALDSLLHGVKTEKKETITVRSKLYPHHSIEIPKDSGGEKTEKGCDVSQRVSEPSKKSNISSDSKPPEPIFNEEEIWGDEPREDEFEFISWEDMLNYFKKRGYIVVKWEDLQFLYKLVDNELPEYIPKVRDRIIRIKEAYNIE